MASAAKRGAVVDRMAGGRPTEPRLQGGQGDMRTSGGGALGQRKNQCSRPELGTCLVCSVGVEAPVAGAE